MRYAFFSYCGVQSIADPYVRTVFGAICIPRYIADNPNRFTFKGWRKNNNLRPIPRRSLYRLPLAHDCTPQGTPGNTPQCPSENDQPSSSIQTVQKWIMTAFSVSKWLWGANALPDAS